MIFVFKNKAKIIGTIGVVKIDVNCAEIKRLYVDRAYRGQKRGFQLLKTAIKYCKNNHFSRVEIFTRLVFDKAISLYRSVGFQEFLTEGDKIYMKLEI